MDSRQILAPIYRRWLDGVRFSLLPKACLECPIFDFSTSRFGSGSTVYR